MRHLANALQVLGCAVLGVSGWLVLVDPLLVVGMLTSGAALIGAGYVVEASADVSIDEDGEA